jgi:hypothetical protein
MKKLFFTVFFSCALSFAACPVLPSEKGPVSYYGKLKVRAGTPFIDGVKEGREDIKLAQIRGVSFFWSQWSGQFYNANAVERMAKDWKAEVVRAAYGATGSIAAADRQYIKTVVEAAIDYDIYVIIDWHSHSVHNEAETNRAINFFTEMAQLYGSCDNVIFELYNEPLNVEWPGIKAYAEKVIPEIRNYSDNLILVGTPYYSQKIQDVTAIEDINVGYVLHFYAATHPMNGWSSNINSALSRSLPIFVTEYGTTTADGGCSPEVSTCDRDNYNSHNAARADEWHAYMDSKKISSAAWSVFDKYEGSAFFGTVPRGTFDQSPENWADTTKMTASGKYIFKKLNDYYLTAPWNPDNVASIKSLASAAPIGLKFIGNLKLSINLPQSGNASLEIFSLHGKKIGTLLHGEQNSGIFELSLSDLNLKSGTYILLLKQDSQIKSLKIAKK